MRSAGRTVIRRRPRGEPVLVVRCALLRLLRLRARCGAFPVALVLPVLLRYVLLADPRRAAAGRRQTSTVISLMRICGVLSVYVGMSSVNCFAAGLNTS